ncbi:MAG TPA: M48 family metalloprotease, partial [Deltaproteobacteria bacterium]|nr:M48 family metalloprotease [Deltaproteobacteria bacterium]
IPDGHIFVNVGLLLFARDGDEISAVIAHEMGHAQLRHIPENLETQTRITAATILGVLAGTVLSSRNPEAGAAMIFSSLGGGENMRLAYSRQHEYAADEFGAKLLAASGIDPSAMARFLVRLNTMSGPSGAPEYLLTHPFTQNRIALIGKDPAQPRPDASFWTLQAAVCGLLLPPQEAEMRMSALPEPYRSLSGGLLKTRSGDHVGALAMLEKVDLDIARAYSGLNLHALGRSEQAYPLLSAYARSARTKNALAELLMERGEYTEAIAAIEPYRGQNPRVDYQLGVLYEKASRKALSHASFARYFMRSGNAKAALYHLEAALALQSQLPDDIAQELKRMKEDILKAQRPQKG